MPTNGYVLINLKSEILYLNIYILVREPRFKFYQLMA